MEAAAAHNYCSEMKKAVAQTRHLQEPKQQVLAALHQSDSIEYATLVNCLEQRHGPKHLAPVKRMEFKNCVQTFGEGLQNFAADIRHLTYEAYPSVDSEFVQGAAVGSFVDEIQIGKSCC